MTHHYQSSENYSSARHDPMIVATIREALLVLDADLRVQFANAAFLELFQVSEAKTTGQHVYQLGNGQWNIPSLRQLLQVILPEHRVINGYRVEHAFETIGHRIMVLNARKLVNSDLVLLTIDDITERQQYEQQLRDFNTALKARVQKQTNQVRKLALQVTMAEQAERGRIAQMLHDDLQQQLFGIKLQAGLLAGSTNDPHLQQELRQIEAELDNALLSTRHLSAELSPPILQEEGLIEAINWLSHEFETRYNLKIEVETEAAFLMPDEKQTVLVFQVIRELLFNIVKHAQVSQVSIRLQQLDEVHRIDIRDTGVGFDPSQVLDVTPVTSGRGLITARNRLQLIGGNLAIKSAPGAGTQMTIDLPIEASLPESEQE